MCNIELSSLLALLNYMEESYHILGVGISLRNAKEIGVEHQLYGLHSLRSGRATSAVGNNSNLLERVLKLHGRWKSDTAKDMDILEDISMRLQVTGQLG